MRKKIQLDASCCTLCDDCPIEDVQHRFFECSFNQGFWWGIGVDYNNGLNIMDAIKDAKRRYEHNHFMEILIVGC